MRRSVLAGLVAALVASLVLTGCAASGSDQPLEGGGPAPDREVAAEAPPPELDEGVAGPEVEASVPEPDDATEDPGPTPPEPGATEQSDAERPVEALAFTARSLAGGTVDLAAFSGDAVALWMWAPW